MSERPPETNSLINRILAGDAGAFKQLVENHQRLVSHIVFRMVANRQDQEDLCQDVFVKVYRNLKRFRFESKLSTWIAKIAYNTCVSHLEKKKIPLVEETAIDFEDPAEESDRSKEPDRVAEARDISRHLRREINNLPLHYRTALTLYHLDAMSYAEVADIMGKPEGTVKSHLFRGRRLLKDRLLSKYRLEELWG
ncbi:MAG: sigma-70 family RNA polymerase sigma factor [Candidatus Zixiibacteriota bacterium]|nr:MAG: sigma-70 family RNA polymerase sigma factor [candidate division Zixibacteria bacterium]